MNIRKWLRGWLNADLVINPSRPAVGGGASEHERNYQPSVRVSVLPAMNGRVLEVGVYKPNPRGPDWTFELFIVPENATLASAITTVLAMKAVEH